MWIAHFTAPMLLYYLFPDHIAAYPLLFGAVIANLDALIVKLKIKADHYHLDSFFHSITFGALLAAPLVVFGNRIAASFFLGHFIHLLLDIGSSTGVRLLYPMSRTFSLNLWENTFPKGFRADYRHYFSHYPFLLESGIFLALCAVLPEAVIEYFAGLDSVIMYVIVGVSLCCFLFFENYFRYSGIVGVGFLCVGIIGDLEYLAGVFLLYMIFNLYFGSLFEICGPYNRKNVVLPPSVILINVLSFSDLLDVQDVPRWPTAAGFLLLLASYLTISAIVIKEAKGNTGATAQKN